MWRFVLCSEFLNVLGRAMRFSVLFWVNCMSFLGIWWPRLVWLISGTRIEDANSVERATKKNTYAIGLLFAFNIFYKTEIFLVSISNGLLQTIVNINYVQTSRQLLTFSDPKTTLWDASRKNLRQNVQNGSGDIQRKEWNHARRRGSAEPMNGQFWKKKTLLNDKEKRNEVLDRKTRTAMYGYHLLREIASCL